MWVMLYYKDDSGDYHELLDPKFSCMCYLPASTEEEALAINSQECVRYPESTYHTINGNDIHDYEFEIPDKGGCFRVKDLKSGQTDPFTFENVQKELDVRMLEPDKKTGIRLSTDPAYYPSQGDSSLCGMAAFYYCLLKDRHDIYFQTIEDLWLTGRTLLGMLEIKPGKSCKNPTDMLDGRGVPRISAIDWMTLAGTRDSMNTFLSYDSPDDQTAGITKAEAIDECFLAVGAKNKLENITGGMYLANSGLQEICNLNAYVGDSFHVIINIHPELLSSNDGFYQRNWIVLESKLQLDDGSNNDVTVQTPLNSLVKLTVFSWGNVNSKLLKNTNLKYFLDNFYGGMVFEKIP
ncbi:hypothetical protein AIT98_000586 [Salmonella enterica subsp. indica]|uniref:Uncharacterized protein n=1 Tax=Salmonella enterica TaxID=28901 RepID=A0A702EH92_SALER|nr:hypothetical protein [Salmonella enterica]HAC6576944.1 hypothetical protein [Salmonella enterica subsp. indica]HBC0059339.1 hypothetical protein [Salmonella enterica]HCL5302805.1 hypothetical protein [Salmonella enterica]